MADEEFGKADSSASNQCGVTLMNNQDGYDVARVMKEKDNVTVRELPSMIPRRRHGHVRVPVRRAERRRRA